MTTPEEMCVCLNPAIRAATRAITHQSAHRFWPLLGALKNELSRDSPPASASLREVFAVQSHHPNPRDCAKHMASAEHFRLQALVPPDSACLRED